jgi:phage gp29-like protein
MQPNPAADENDFEGTIKDILDAWGKGISVLEILWEHRKSDHGQVFAPRATQYLHPRYYGYPSQRSELMLVAREQGVTLPEGIETVEAAYAPFPENKFLINVAKAKSGHPLGAALLRPLAWWWCAANFGAEWLLNYAQLFGQPIRWATYDKNQPGILNELSAMLENMGSSGWGAFPAGTSLELKEATKSGGENPQAFLLTLADKTCDILIIGQTLTTDVADSGSRALGSVHEGVKGEIINSAASWVARILNTQLIPSICRLNYGEENECPYLDPFGKTEEDAKALAERDQILLGQGVELPRSWFYDRHNIPQPAAGEAVITGHKPAGMFDGSQVPSLPPEKSAKVQAKSAQDQLVDNVLEDLTGVQAKWLQGIRPYFERIFAKASAADVSDAEFLQVIQAAEREFPELFHKLDITTLQDALERAMGAAAANGAIKGALLRRKKVAS